MSIQVPSPEPVSTVVTFLEMTRQPVIAPVDLSGKNALVQHIVKPEIPFYRHLYDAVGREYLWVNRKHWNDDQLSKTIHDEAVEIHCLYVGDRLAGYSELDFRLAPDVEITFFGLLPEFIGKGLSRPFLEAMLNVAWRPPTERVHLQTCTCDHPAALPLYQKVGFVPFGRTTETLTPVSD